MARSFRRTPIAGITTAETEKPDKQKANRRYRHAVRVAIAEGRDHIPSRRELTDPWHMAKDGKKWFSPSARAGILRK